ncbi:MAG: molybdopterin dinucleotide binding domain-containing protein [Caldilineaceae bacterium]
MGGTARTRRSTPPTQKPSTSGDGGPVVIHSRCGQVRNSRLRISDRVPPGTIFLAFHWREAPANVLTHDFELDPTPRSPSTRCPRCGWRIRSTAAG